MTDRRASAGRAGKTARRTRPPDRTPRSEAALLRTILDTLPIGVAHLVQRRFVRVNPAFCRIFGVTEEQVREATTERFYPSREEFEAFGREAYPRLALGEVFQTERLMRRSDGELRWIWMVGRAVDPQDETAGSIWSLEDIHELKSAQDALAESEARYRRLIESLPDVVYSYVPQTGERFCSPQIGRIFGIDIDATEWPGGAWRKSIHPDDLARVDALFTDTHAGSVFQAEYRIRDRDGGWRWVRDRARTRRDVAGRLVIEGILADISGIRAAEVALRERDELLRKLSERVPGVIYQFRMDASGGMSFPYVSEGAREVFGATPSQIRERHQEMMGRIVPEDYQRMMDATLESFRNLTPFHCELRADSRERGLRWLQVDSMPEKLEDGSVLWHGYVNDVTERKEAERSLIESERRYRALFDANPSPMWIYDLETLRFLEVNPAAVGHYGYAREEFLAMTIKDIRPPEDVPRLLENIAALDADRVDRAGVWRHLKKHGETILVEIQSKQIRYDGRAAELVVANDVTERVRAEEELLLAAKVFESSRQAIMITDTRPSIVRVNRAFEQITGYSAAEAVGSNPSMLSSGRQDESFYAALWRQLSERGYWEGELWNRRKDGALYPEYLSISAVRGRDGRVTNYVGLFNDISERKAAEERIQFLAHHDALTGLPNRVLLRDRATVAIAFAQRQASRLALLYMDLDRFKTINDSLGHEVGDELLRQAAQRIAAQVRATDTVCRQGGDEFIILLSEIAETQDAGRVAEKLIEAINQPFSIDGHELLVTASIGIAAFPENGRGLDELQRNADSAMYAAKDSGRNTYRYYSPAMNERALEYLATERDLRHALERDELYLACQPQVALQDGSLVGYEVLARWRHPDRGEVPPGYFIPIAEESGLIAAIGEWILREACRQRRQFERAGLADIPVAVNISAAQFARPEFVERVAAILQNEGLRPSLLELEVTETVIMQGSRVVLASLQRLDRMGIRLAIDDFGTGYSSLNYLKRFPVKKLKIDQSFVRDLPGDEGDGAIAKAVIVMGHALGMRVIAEGVETRSQAEFLQHHGCDEAQGFRYGRPMPATEFLELALEWDRRARLSA